MTTIKNTQDGTTYRLLALIPVAGRPERFAAKVTRLNGRRDGEFVVYENGEHSRVNFSTVRNAW